jgi:crotonobetainyl-CoA:carnitine CoA-transferase CaiB-like acyl-CoA transferase
MNRPLSGIIVLYFGRILSGPYAIQLLADMGAEVIKVERPGGSRDKMRAYGRALSASARAISQ